MALASQRGPPFPVACGLLEGVGELQHAEVILMPPNNLDADR
jgi:hypothetical protein